MSDSDVGIGRPAVRTNLLNTRTTNLLELVGNGRVFRVPPYQRDYSWSEEQWEDLWTDVVDLRGDRAQRHYMGALVVEGTSDREFSIIDGQQRLATLRDYLKTGMRAALTAEQEAQDGERAAEARGAAADLAGAG